MDSIDIVTNYRENVIAAHSIQQCIDWNQRHGLPLMDLPDQLRNLREKILMFEDVLARIQDRRTRTVIRCRYAFGWSIPETAAFMEVSKELITTLSFLVMKKLQLENVGC